MRVAKRLPSVYEVLGSSISSAAEKKKTIKREVSCFRLRKVGDRRTGGRFCFTSQPQLG